MIFIQASLIWFFIVDSFHGCPCWLSDEKFFGLSFVSSPVVGLLLLLLLLLLFPSGFSSFLAFFGYCSYYSERSGFPERIEAPVSKRLSEFRRWSAAFAPFKDCLWRIALSDSNSSLSSAIAAEIMRFYASIDPLRISAGTQYGTDAGAESLAFWLFYYATNEFCT